MSNAGHFTKSMNPRITCIGHQFFDLYRNLFIWKHNNNSIQYIVNHLEDFCIESPHWLENSLTLYDKFMSFALDFQLGVPFQTIDFVPNYVETRNTLTFEKCRELGLIKKRNKNLLWLSHYDGLMSEWIHTYCNWNDSILRLFLQ